MLTTAVSRAATDDGFAKAVGLNLPACPYEDPPLNAVLGAVARATDHVWRLLARKSKSWPLREFAVKTTSDPSNGHVEVAYVAGAARPSAGEIAGSPLGLESGGTLDGEHARLRSIVEAVGGLPVDWTVRGGVENPEVATALVAASMPLLPPALAEAFSANVLSGGEGARAMGPEEAWGRVEQLDAYLGPGLVPQELCCRLTEALAGGVMMRGSPPPWRTLVRDAVLRRVEAAVGGGEGTGRGTGRPVVVHFVAAYGQDRLEVGEDVVIPGLLEAEDFRAVSVRLEKC